MSLTVSASSGSSNFVQVPAGMHLARCYRIIDLGTQKTEYQGQSKMSPKVLFQFEIHGENESGEPLVTSEGKPLVISKQYTLSLNENSNLRKDLQSWRGKEFSPEELKSFNLENILGQWCMVAVVHSEYNGKSYSNISNINPVPAAVKKNGLPEGVNDTKLFSIRSADMEFFNNLSDGIKAKIMQSPEWEVWNKPTANTNERGNEFDDMSDDIPFN